MFSSVPEAITKRRSPQQDVAEDAAHAHRRVKAGVATRQERRQGVSGEVSTRKRNVENVKKKEDGSEQQQQQESD